MIATLFGLPCVVAWASSEVTSEWSYQARTALQLQLHRPQKLRPKPKAASGSDISFMLLKQGNWLWLL
ncbi:MAG: hypothetical protein RSE18_16800 [Acinetobacter sp.]